MLPVATPRSVQILSQQIVLRPRREDEPPISTSCWRKRRRACADSKQHATRCQSVHAYARGFVKSCRLAKQSAHEAGGYARSYTFAWSALTYNHHSSVGSGVWRQEVCLCQLHGASAACSLAQMSTMPQASALAFTAFDPAHPLGLQASRLALQASSIWVYLQTVQPPLQQRV
jgi:hypothetical protein